MILCSKCPGSTGRGKIREEGRSALRAVGAHDICALPSRRNHRGLKHNAPASGGYAIRPYDRIDRVTVGAASSRPRRTAGSDAPSSAAPGSNHAVGRGAHTPPHPGRRNHRGRIATHPVPAACGHAALRRLGGRCGRRTALHPGPGGRLIAAPTFPTPEAFHVPQGHFTWRSHISPPTAIARGTHPCPQSQKGGHCAPLLVLCGVSSAR